MADPVEAPTDPDDIVFELREAHRLSNVGDAYESVFSAAADEIERLRAVSSPPSTDPAPTRLEAAINAVRHVRAFGGFGEGNAYEVVTELIDAAIDTLEPAVPSTDPPSESLWLVFTGWQGNGCEGVLVAAGDEMEAVIGAQSALVTQAEAEIAGWAKRFPLGGSHAEHLAEKLADFRDGSMLTAERIELPYIGEFG